MTDVFMEIDGKRYRIVIAKINGEIRVVGGYVRRSTYKGALCKKEYTWCAIPDRWTGIWGKIHTQLKSMSESG